MMNLPDRTNDVSIDAHARMGEYFRADEPEPVYTPPTYEYKKIRLRANEE